MNHNEFEIGKRFYTETGAWQCTDMGSRTVIAVRLDARTSADPSWLNGPPYAVAEHVFDEYDLEGCTPTREVE